jgi:hypothetical protein
MADIQTKDTKESQATLKESFVAQTRSAFNALKGEIAERNQHIEERDQFIYGDLLEKSLDIPIGHDMTPVNWLRRSVEIHKNMFMGRGFGLISTYDSRDSSQGANEEDQQRITIENKKHKEYAEARHNLIKAIIEDNGGDALWASLAESASAVGTAALKAYYDKEKEIYVLSPIEAIENLYVLWNKDDFRSYDAVAYVHQVSKLKAMEEYGVSEDVATSPMGQPLEIVGENTTATQSYTQPMVTIMEVTGKIEGWKSVKGNLQRCKPGNETMLNAFIVGNKLVSVIDETKKLPKYYIFPNKRVRRRPWGVSDISDAAININLTYVETLSDWRTVSAKINFPKYKAYGFGPDTQLPKSEPRKVQAIPLADGQDMQLLEQGISQQMDFRAQMEEEKEQFVRETGLSRVLFDDPSVTLNSNQALLTSMKPTSDIAEAKKQLWNPILRELFQDALETLAMYNSDVKEITSDEDRWSLKVMWPSLMQKEDPVFQQMLLNRKNAGVISIQSYLEAQGESKEELDRIKEEMQDPITAAIHGNMLNFMAEQLLAPPQDGPPQPKTTINLRGDLTPQQEANYADQLGFQDGPFGASMGPQGTQGNIAYQNQDNQEFLEGDFPNQMPITRGPDGQPRGMEQQPQGGAQGQMTTQAQNQEGQGVMSQPGSGATTTSPQGALNQANQNQGG